MGSTQEWRRQRKETSDPEHGVVEITQSKQQSGDWKKKKVNIASETCRTLIKDLTFMLPGLHKRRRKREG